MNESFHREFHDRPVRDFDYHHRRPLGSPGFKGRWESQGDAINNMMTREMTKQANLRARLRDLGFDQTQIERCFVTASEDAEDDTVTIPWSVAFRAFNRSDGLAMGVMD